ncbi:MAG: hypothetical protein ACYTE2_00240 [Planctomycetota bacterium]
MAATSAFLVAEARPRRLACPPAGDTPPRLATIPAKRHAAVEGRS